MNFSQKLKRTLGSRNNQNKLGSSSSSDDAFPKVAVVGLAKAVFGIRGAGMAKPSFDICVGKYDVFSSVGAFELVSK